MGMSWTHSVSVDRYFYFASFIKNQVQFVTLVQIKTSSNEEKTSSDHDIAEILPTWCKKKQCLTHHSVHNVRSSQFKCILSVTGS